MKLPEPVGALYTIAGAQHCTITQALTDTNLYTEMQMIELRRATIEECALLCCEQADDANSNKRKPLLTDNGKTLYEGMTVSAWNCVAAIRNMDK